MIGYWQFYVHPGVFARYTSLPTNLLFFDRSGPTQDIWYYEQRLPKPVLVEESGGK
jgi:hypothetical protein